MRYACASTWAEYFEKKENVAISSSIIQKRIKIARIIGIPARDSSGRVLENSMHSESDVRYACADLLQDLPQANKSGFFEKDGEKYGSTTTWSKTLPISSTTIHKHLKSSVAKPIQVKNNSGRITDFYSESDIRIVYAELLMKNPPTEKSGFFEKGGEKYGHMYAWSKVLPISASSIIKHLHKFKIKSIKGRDNCGRITNFYSESDVRRACAEPLTEFPQANKYGFFEKDGEKYDTLESWSKALPISGPTIKGCLQKFKIKSIKGKDSRGRIFNFYSESDVHSACADLLEKRNPKAA